jgi:hypothetical protein
MLVHLRKVVAEAEPGPEHLVDLASGEPVTDPSALEFAHQLELLTHNEHTTPGQTHAVGGFAADLTLVARHLSEPRTFTSPLDPLADTDLAQDGLRLLTRSKRGIVRVLATDDWRETCPPLCAGDPLARAVRRPARSAHFAPRSDLVATTDGSEVRLWDARNGLSLARIPFPGAINAWVNADFELVVDYDLSNPPDDERGLVLGRLPAFEGDLSTLKPSLALRLDREWNGQSVRLLNWREVLQRALELDPKSAGFRILHVEAPSASAWQVEALQPGEGG